MKYEHVLELVKAVSDSKVTSFQYEEGETKISIKVGHGRPPHHGMMPLGHVPQHTEATEHHTTIEGANVVSSPLVGTFYMAPSEEAEPFVKVGDTVKKGQTLAIIEAMKLMNEIESDYDGEVVEILVGNGQGVEYGQSLFIIE